MASHARRRVSLLVSLLVALGALVAIGTSPASSTTDGVLFGGHPGPRSGESDQTALARFEQDAGRDLDVVREFVRWDGEFPDAFQTQLKASGQTMILSVKSQRANGSKIPFADVAAAQPGSPLYADLVSWAQRIKAYGAPIYFTYNHEPESSVSQPMGEDFEFIAAWRRVHEIFDEQGVTNVTWMWIMTDYAFWVGSHARNDGSKWYPGDDYVDAMGIDAYNWYTCRTGINNRWKSLEEIITPFRDFGAQHPDKELWLTEFASTEDPEQPGRKAAWYAEAQALFKRPDFAQFAGISQFDVKGQGNCHWYYDSSPSAHAAFRTWAEDPFYGGAGAPPPQPLPQPPGELDLVAAEGTNANRMNHSVDIPGSVEPGDALLLHWAANNNKGTLTPPSGWTEVTSTDLNGIRGGVWLRTAQPGDAGSTVTIRTSAYAKSDLGITAYRDAHQTPIDAWQAAAQTTTGTTHDAPAVTPPDDGSRVVVYVADKSSSNTTLTAPAGLTTRRTSTGDAGGHITAVLADTAGPVAAGVPAGPFTFQGAAASSGAVMYTVALRPAE